jgi:hypothetical protein
VASQPVASPWNAQAANSEAGALKREEDSLAGLSSQWLLTQQRYGLEGPYADYKSNPYSEAARLQRSYDNARRGTVNGAGLQLYAGSTVNHQNQNTSHFNEGRDSLEKAYAAAGAQNQAERLAAENAYAEAVDNARWEALQTQLAEKPEAATAPEASGPAGVQGKSKGRITKAFRRGKNI